MKDELVPAAHMASLYEKSSGARFKLKLSWNKEHITIIGR